MSSFADALVAFTSLLRVRHGFAVAQRETADALRALETLGMRRAASVRAGLRAVYCANAEESAAFDAAFDAFFLRRPASTRNDRPPLSSAQSIRAQRESGAGRGTNALPREAAMESDAAGLWEAFRARYSPGTARTAAPVISVDGLDEMGRAVRLLVERVRITHSRRRIRHQQGRAVDLRRTLRAGVATLAEPIDLYRTKPARRGARFVALIDGSRSMGEENRAALQFAYALCRRTARAHAFTFSTALREVTSAMRDAGQRGRALADLGAGWGGGTRIGESLAAFTRAHRGLVRGDTIVLIFSDGLDVGSLDALERALRELARRARAIVWVHPAGALRGFAPEAGGLRTARPFIDAFSTLRDAADAPRLARMIARIAG